MLMQFAEFIALLLREGGASAGEYFVSVFYCELKSRGMGRQCTR